MPEVLDQKRAFLEGEGDAYHFRNLDREHGRDGDPAVQVVRRLKLEGSTVLEIGCASAHRLAELNGLISAECFGIDPSKAAIESARERYPYMTLEVGTAAALPFPNDRFDLVIFGFCLYLVDPVDLFSAVREADRVLKDCGTLLIWDFSTPVPYGKQYHHRTGILTRKMEWSRMFTCNPAYTLVHREWVGAEGTTLLDVDARTTVDVLVKDTSAAFPLRHRAPSDA